MAAWYIVINAALDPRHRGAQAAQGG